MPEEELRHRLTRLQQAEFLFETGLFPDLEYTFTHALTHGVAYGSLLQERRRTLHGRILETLESLTGAPRSSCSPITPSAARCTKAVTIAAGGRQGGGRRPREAVALERR
jgi:hypothetical protein